MAGPGAQTAQLVTHLLQQTTATLALLESLRVISPDDAHAIKGRLPNAYGPFPSLEPVPALPARGVADKQPAAADAVEIRAPEALHARALWDYGANQADDLPFSAGDILVIDERVNPQWNRGHLLHDPSRRGLFPSNYVELTANTHPPIQAYASGPPAVYQPGPAAYQPGPPAAYQPGPPAAYQGQPPEHDKKGRFGKIGGQLGNAAVNGAGFGFGASIASEMVHKIF